jgi:hypothetical protein
MPPHKPRPVPSSITIDDLRAATAVLPHSEVRSIEEQAYDLRLSGYQPRDIAAALRRPLDEVETMLDARIDAARQKIQASQGTAIVLEIDRLDFMIRTLWPSVCSGDHGAIDRVKALGQERRKLLGLDAPEVKASLNLTADASAADLSKLDPEDLKALARIQAKLSTARPSEKLVQSPPKRALPAAPSEKSSKP